MEITVKELARREQVSPRTVRRWIAKEAIRVNRTPGGGIRIPVYRRAIIVDMSDGDKEGHPSR